MGWVVLLALVVLAGALPILAERRRNPITETQRRTAPGGFADLTGGLTHYRWFGPEGGPVMVLVHGVSSSAYVWEGLVPRLIAKGARVLVYDLYGRGLSDRPATAQTRSFFVRQLRELLQDQGVEDGFTLIGYSMGGAIATVFAAEEAERIDKLILIAPAGLIQRRAPFVDFCRRVPYLGDWLFGLFGGIALRRGLDPDAPSTVPTIAARQAAETRTQGYLRSVLSSQRYFLAEPLADDLAEVRRMQVPTLAIWGTADRVIPLRAMGELARANREARQAEVAGAGHGLVHSHPEEVNRAIQTFLREIDGPPI
ncbi:alpha/beta fold hydrolase [Frigidibacter sp. ROC022]|uniref:alpha/beta fold hydrolase n=1 Tax=Frigidibacter sp. ROC022 TaxID=2971796 RepID=UPI00215AEB7E|nr:alpha/beta hydrolase [Frigidibacter sp. ROC022]MCR8726594.1 alpha/beta hydrolase [Frigidibacter sp. ROC022]